MTYLPNIPIDSLSPKDTALQIQTNFAQFASIYANNHTALNGNFQGDHEGVILTNQAADPGVTDSMAVIYCRNATSKAGTQPQLFVQIPKFLPHSPDTTDAPNFGMQLTYNQVNIVGPNQYQSFLPGGLLFYFGVDSGTSVVGSSIADIITLSPAPTQILIAIATPGSLRLGLPLTVSTQVTSNSTFTINSAKQVGGAPTPYLFNWMCIAIA